MTSLRQNLVASANTVQKDDEWCGLSKFEPKYAAGKQPSDYVLQRYQTIKRILSEADFTYLEQRAVAVRKQHHVDLPLDLSCSIDREKFASGRQNLVMLITFSDNVQWVARISYDQGIDTNPSANAAKIPSEVATMRYVRKHTRIPVPETFDFEASADGRFGCPYILMERFRGNTVKVPTLGSVEPQYLEKVAKQLAGVLFELRNLTFDRIGRLWCGKNAKEPVRIIPSGHRFPSRLHDNSFDYFNTHLHSVVRAALRPDRDNRDMITAGWLLEIAVRRTVVHDWLRGPFPLCHFDLHAQNLLFDDDYNLTGVIDWSSAETAPVEQLVVNPAIGWYSCAPAETRQRCTEFRNLVAHFLEVFEAADHYGLPSDNDIESSDRYGSNGRAVRETVHQQTRLSSYVVSEGSELLWHFARCNPQQTIGAAKLCAKVLYGDKVTWEQLTRLLADVAA